MIATKSRQVLADRRSLGAVLRGARTGAACARSSRQRLLGGQRGLAGRRRLGGRRAVEVRRRLPVALRRRAGTAGCCAGIERAGCRAGRRPRCRTAAPVFDDGRAERQRLRAAARSGSARTCRCRRSSGPRRTARPACRRTPCSSPTPVVNSSWITTSPVGSSTSRAHLDARSVCGSRSSSAVGQPREVLAGRRAARAATPPSSCGPISGRAWSIHGSAASIVAGVSRTPGRISRANARVGGNAAFSEASARLAVASVERQLADRRAAGCRTRRRTPPSSC